MCGLWFALVVLAATATARAAKLQSLPNLVILLTDDLGFNAPGFRNPDLFTPTLDRLATKQGVILENFYTYRFCSPTRGSLLTGRFPYKLQSPETNFIPWSKPVGTHLGFTMLPAKLKAAGYATAHIGKWHQGFYKPEYTPGPRGFDSTFGFLVGGEDHYTQDSTEGSSCKAHSHDLWDNGVNAFNRTGTPRNPKFYNGYTFTQRAVDVIHQHVSNQSGKPLFLYFAIHNTHFPFEAPPRFVERYNFNLTLRNVFDGMVSVVDETVENVTKALVDTGMWNNTLLLWATDNGSPVQKGGSNDPLRGGKGSNFEGGCRVPAFITGGLLPRNMHGKRLAGLAHITDVYNTFSALAGLPAGDPSAIAPAPTDSLDLGPYWMGAANASPRNEIVYDHKTNVTYPHLANISYGAIRLGDYKLIRHEGRGEPQATWYGHFTPNRSFAGKDFVACGDTSPCLFNLRDDPTEHVNLLDVKPRTTLIAQQYQLLLNRMDELRMEYHPPPNPKPQPDAYCEHVASNRGFISPWVSA